MVEDVKKSMLVPVGWMLLVAGIFAPNLVLQIAQTGRADNGQLSMMARILYVATDLLRLCFFAGIGCLIIGSLRNKKIRKSEKSSELVDDGQTWKCHKCSHENPNNTYQCQKCGFSLV